MTQTQSIDDVLSQNTVKTLGGAFPPVADMKKKGERFLGKYLGHQMIQPVGFKQPARSHLFELHRSECSWFQSKTPVTPENGSRVSITSNVIDRILSDADAGKLMVVTLDGMGMAKGTNAAPRLYTISIVGA